MALPSADDVRVRQYNFQIELNLSSAAQIRTDTEREQAQALAVDLCDAVEFFYRPDLDPSSRRVKCERWGVVYFFEPVVTPPAPVVPPVP